MSRLACAALALAALFVVACKPAPPVTAAVPTVAPADPLWSQLLAGHSTGAVSRRAPLRVVFTNDVIPAAKVGADASAVVSIEPAVKARIVFAASREIVATPVGGEFAPGQVYKV